MDLAQRGDPDGRREFLHAALEGLQLHERAELFQTFLIVRCWNRPKNRVAMGGSYLGLVRLEVQFEKSPELLGVVISGGAVVAVIDPQHGDVRLHLHAEMENDGFVRAEVRRDDGARVRQGDGPADDFERRLIAQFGVGFGKLFRSHAHE